MAATIPASVKILWLGTVASIPSGWKRYTAFDSRFINGVTGNPDASDHGGSHSHTVSTHGHTESHTHTLSFSTVTGGNRRNTGGTTVSRGQHKHPDTTSSVSTGSVSNTTDTTTATSTAEPVHKEVIFIEPTSGGVQIPIDAVIFAFQDVTDSNFKFANGTLSTDDLDDSFVKGAAASSDPGAGGGSATHTHDYEHDHPSSSHSHPDFDVLATAQTETRATSSILAILRPLHHEIVNVDSQSISWQNATTTTDAVSNNPAFHYLFAVQNKGASAQDVKVGMIGIWTSTSASIPSEWALCDGSTSNGEVTPNCQDRQILISDSSTDVLTTKTGGANNHTHDWSGSHTHTSVGTHDHTWTMQMTLQSQDSNLGFTTPNVATATHSHTITSSAISVISDSNTPPTSDSEDKRASYKECHFIMYVGSSGVPLIMPEQIGFDSLNVR